MAKKPAKKLAKKRGAGKAKASGKMKDLPAKSVKGSKAASVKGGVVVQGGITNLSAGQLSSSQLKLSPSALTYDKW
jgi:hypothetical protein